MYESSRYVAFGSLRRGGTRGGQADFSWDVVREDKHRENYLGNSIAAPKGRWQQGRDILWYNRDTSASRADDAAEQRRKELLRVKQAEQDAMREILGGSMPGGAPSVGSALAQGSRDTPARTGANAAPLDPSKRRYPAPRAEADDAEREARRARHEARRERRHRHEERRHRHDDHRHRHRHRDERARSPRARDDEGRTRRDRDYDSHYDRARRASPRREAVRPRTRSRSPPA
ncbi:hypothetical protein MBRA1_003331 [Malassezia brasiliensis]|uniref:Multiple myeloma tumor-associated protein 2-like N-terminal domain-containing protein n=1 Tax=Malassezia brasiliensis TaxID=1821822 RepID=A0AAF0DW98_9BASI|nr:hypothetical protein MBRA1_003331 [Malassezia brasiliensis]